MMRILEMSCLECSQATHFLEAESSRSDDQGKHRAASQCGEEGGGSELLELTVDMRLLLNQKYATRVQSANAEFSPYYTTYVLYCSVPTLLLFPDLEDSPALPRTSIALLAISIHTVPNSLTNDRPFSHWHYLVPLIFSSRG